MALTDTNLADRNGSLLESHKGYDPRIIFFYFILGAMLIILVVGLGYQQLLKTNDYRKDERYQNQRRIVVPGPRGNIYDRNGNMLVGNRPRFSVRLMVDVLQREIRREQNTIKKNFEKANETEIPAPLERLQIARVTVIQRYLDQVNAILKRKERIDAAALKKHYQGNQFLPYTLLEDLTTEEYARLFERLPRNSPMQLYTFSTREYPYKSAAAHTIGYVGITDDVDVDSEALPGHDLRTFKMKGTAGREGIERKYDDQLQGEAGGAVFRVNNTGIRMGEPLARLQPKQGKNIQLSLDIDMQLAAEKAMANTQFPGGVVAMDVATGEVLVMASKPDYDLSEFSPRISQKTWQEAEAQGAFYPRALSGLYPPGSSFKILTSIAGLRSGNITPATTVTCPGVFRVGNRLMECHDRHAHGTINLVTAIELSCNVFFYQTGLETGVDAIAAEAKRFHLDRPTGIEMLSETRGMIVPDPEWKEKNRGEKWLGGDTAQLAIGQNALILTPLQMACFAASVGRNEVWTQPTLLHDPNRPRQKTEPIGLTPEQRAVLIRGMQQVALTGTAKMFQNARVLTPLTGLTIAAKTGTAQKDSPKGTINFAWLIAFAPIENPQIAIAIALEGNTPGEETGGGFYATPIAHAILKTWLDKKNQPAAPRVQLIKSK